MIGTDTLATAWEGWTPEQWRVTLAVPEFLAYDVVSSTSDVIRNRAGDGAPAGTLCIAEHQSLGRGQFGRRWQDVPGDSLLLSILIRPIHGRDAPTDHAPTDGAPTHDTPTDDAPTDDARATGTQTDVTIAPGALPIRVGLAVARAIRSATGVDTLIKWPNDLVVPAAASAAVPFRKVAGILCEAVGAGTDDGFICVGIGINISQPDAAWADELSGRATSIAAAARGAGLRAPRRADILAAVVEALRPLWSAPLLPLDAAAIAEFERIDALSGRHVTVTTGDAQPAVIAAGIRPDGALRILDGGVESALFHGSVQPTPEPPLQRNA